jgi:predicted TIM-barrel fold metal-dependent hydrolase
MRRIADEIARPMPTPHDPDAGREPAFVAPKLACDAHFHVFGPADKYPYVITDLRYAPPVQPLSAHLRLARRLGIERFVLVQPSAYGLDNSCMFDAMDEIDPALRRGIVHLDETRANDAELGRWHAKGVRGVRINISPIRQPEPGLSAALRPKIMRSADICRELGWHLDLLLPGWLVSELMPTLRELPVGFTVAHMGLFPARNGVTQPGFQEFLSLANDGSKRCWVKLTGIYRFSEDPTFADVKPFAQALIATVPDQLIWGSDFPHLSFHERVGTIQLYNLLLDWAPDPGMRKRILTDNPARLFEFA